MRKLSAAEVEDLRHSIRQCGISQLSLQDLCGIPNDRLRQAMMRKIRISEPELTKVREYLAMNAPLPDLNMRMAALEAQDLHNRIANLERRFPAAEPDCSWANENEKARFSGFEHICRQMIKISPELFERSVHRARQTVF